MITGMTKAGFKFELDESALDNWELIESLQKVDTGHSGYIVDSAKLLLGKNQYEDLKTFLKEKDGMIKATTMYEEISSIFEVTKLKNS